MKNWSAVPLAVSYADKHCWAGQHRAFVRSRYDRATQLLEHHFLAGIAAFFWVKAPEGVIKGEATAASEDGSDQNDVGSSSVAGQRMGQCRGERRSCATENYDMHGSRKKKGVLMKWLALLVAQLLLTPDSSRSVFGSESVVAFPRTDTTHSSPSHSTIVRTGNERTRTATWTFAIVPRCSGAEVLDLAANWRPFGMI